MLTKVLTVSTLSMTLLISASTVLSQEDPLCFMRRSDGTIVNLSKLCKNKKPMPQQPAQPVPDSDQGSDGGQPSPPDNVLDSSVDLVPGQTQKPPIEVFDKPSELWQQTPGLSAPIQEAPAQQQNGN